MHVRRSIGSLSCAVSLSSHRITRATLWNPFKKKEQKSDEPFNLGSMMPRGAPMPKWLETLANKNMGQLRRMVEMHDASQSQGNKGFPGGDFLKRMMQAQESLMKATGKGEQPSSPSRPQQQSSPNQSQSAAASDLNTQTDLGPELEELFAELRSVRQKKNELKRQLAAKTEEHDGAKKEIFILNTALADMRMRLLHAEKNVALLNTESVELKEKIRDLKGLEKKVRALQSTLESRKAQDPALFAAKVEALERALKEKSEQLRSTARKLDRARQRSPLLQFSLHLSAIAHATGSSYDAAGVDALFSRLQGGYEVHILEDWTTAAPANGAHWALSAACKQYLRARVPHAMLDATLLVEDGSTDSVREVLGDEFTVTEDEIDDMKVLRVAVASNQVPTLGAYGFLDALQAAQSDTFFTPRLPFRIRRVAPFLSDSIISNTDRSKIEVEHTRSSGPGGQATNVSDTHITVKLLVDGKLMLMAASQETRSAQMNQRTATSKLFGMERENCNEKWWRMNSEGESVVPRCNADVVIDKQRWNEICEWALPALSSPLDRGVVSAVRMSTASS